MMNVKTLEARQVDQSIDRLLGDHDAATASYRLVSLFKQTVNLTLEGSPYLWGISKASGQEMPGSVELSATDFDLLRSFLTLQTKVKFRPMEEAFELTTNQKVKFKLSFKEAKRFNPELKAETSLTYHQLKTAIKDLSQANHHVLMTGFGFSLLEWIQLLEDGETKDLIAPVILKRANLLKKEASLRVGLQSLIGSGIGLTPSGDDFLIGTMATGKLEDVSIRQTIKTLLRESADLTTNVSKHYLLSASDQRFMKLVRSLLLSQDVDQVKQLLLAFVHYGHTSGMDLLAGVVWSLFEKSPNQV